MFWRFKVLCFSIESFENQLVDLRKTCWDFDFDCTNSIESVICLNLRRIGIFFKMSLPIHEHIISLTGGFRGFSFFFKVFFFFLMWTTFFKSLLNSLQYCSCFVFWVFSHEACGVFAPWPKMEPTPPALKGEILTTESPGKSQGFHFYSFESKS